MFAWRYCDQRAESADTAIRRTRQNLLPNLSDLCNNFWMCSQSSRRRIFILPEKAYAPCFPIPAFPNIFFSTLDSICHVGFLITRRARPTDVTGGFQILQIISFVTQLCLTWASRDYGLDLVWLSNICLSPSRWWWTQLYSRKMSLQYKHLPYISFRGIRMCLLSSHFTSLWVCKLSSYVLCCQSIFSRTNRPTCNYMQL